MGSSPPFAAPPGHCNGVVEAVGVAAQKSMEGGGAGAGGVGAPLSHVDPFLVEALENPRHRLTVLRMELDIQRFMQNPDQYQFEFQHFPTSYLRCATHRVAQHYGLQTMVLDNVIDGAGRIVAVKTPESRYPSVCLSDIPTKQPENEKPEQLKITIRPRPNRDSLNDAVELGMKRSPARTVAEREEEYDRARARIFSSFSSPGVEGASFQVLAGGKSEFSSRGGFEGHRKIVEEPEKNGTKDGSSRVAIFRDREKDRTDPDYDRSYNRYFRAPTSNQAFNLGIYNMFQPSYLQYESGFPQIGHGLSNPNMGPYHGVGCNQTSGDSIYMQWPSPAMMYAQSYEQFRNSVFQAPFYQQPLSFEHSQNH